MNVGLFADCYPPTLSGVATALVQLQAGLARRGHRVVVAAVADGRHFEKEETVYRFPSLPFNRASGFRLGWVNQRAVDRLVQDHRLDLIHTHTEYSLGWAGRRAARKFDLPLLHTAHTLHPAYRHYLPLGERLPPALVHRFLGGYLRRFLAGCDQVVCPSPKAQDYVQTLAPALPTAVIPNGLDRARFCPRPLSRQEKAQMRRDLGLDASDGVLLFVGRLGSEKRVLALLAALLPLLAGQPHCKLLFVGDGPSCGALEQAASVGGCSEQVLLAGPVPWTDTHRYYSIADLFVTASLSEMHPLTLIEAAACGLPLVARRDEAYAGLVLPGYNGYLADSDRQLAACTVSLLADEARRQTFSENAARLADRFGMERHVDQIEALYQGFHILR